MKRFSIITITYNAEKYLQKTLESVASQEFTDYEHIVWDGGSQDGTLDIVKNFPHVTLYQGKDVGIADAMNQGAKRAKGQLLIHLHADDLLAHPRVLTFIDTAFKQHPDAKWLYGKIRYIDSQGNSIPQSPKFHLFDYKRLEKYNFISHPAVCVSRDLFEDAQGFDVQLRYAMDYDLWMRLGKMCAPLALPTDLSCFREHDQSLSTSLPKKVAIEAYEVRNRYLTSLWKKWRSYRTLRKRLSKI